MITSEKTGAIHDLALRFSGRIPEHKFTIAETQGYLLRHKRDPQSGVEGAEAWVQQQMKEREERKKNFAKNKEKRKSEKAKAVNEIYCRIYLGPGSDILILNANLEDSVYCRYIMIT